MIVIGISGKKQSGKDTLGEFLKNHINAMSGSNSTACTFSFADKLKKSLCMDILGMTWEQCYGTNEQKDTWTDVKWDGLPQSVKLLYANEPGTFRSGYMTGREVMQVIGTDIMRDCIDNMIWINATMSDIYRSDCSVAIITDVRFIIEVDELLSRNNHIIRLSRDVYQDTHPSENELNDYDFTRKNCYYIDNQNQSIDYKNNLGIKALNEILKKEKIVF